MASHYHQRAAPGQTHAAMGQTHATPQSTEAPPPVDDTARRLGALASNGVHHGFVKDDFARMCVGGDYLWTGSPPRVGQRLAIQVSVHSEDCIGTAEPSGVEGGKQAGQQTLSIWAGLTAFVGMLWKMALTLMGDSSTEDRAKGGPMTWFRLSGLVTFVEERDVTRGRA